MESRIIKTNALFGPKDGEVPQNVEGSISETPPKQANPYQQMMVMLNNKWAPNLSKAQTELTRRQIPGIDQNPLAMQAVTMVEMAKEVSYRITSQPGREAMRSVMNPKPEKNINLKLPIA